MRHTYLPQIAVLALVVFSATANAQKFTAGAGRSEVQISENVYPIDGFTGQHDPMVTRVLVLDDGSHRIGIVALDQTSIGKPLIVSMKAVLEKIAGVHPDNAVVIASHTFSAPHVFTGQPNQPAAAGQALPLGGVSASAKTASGAAPSFPHVATTKEQRDPIRSAALDQAIEASVESATTQAITRLQPARVGFGAGTSLVNVNRDVPTAQGWWLGANNTGYVDHSLAIIRIDDLKGKPLALIMNMPVQSSIMDHSVTTKGDKLITSDLGGAAARYLEDYYGPDTVAMFLTGAAGDQEPYLKANRHVVKRDGSVSMVDIHEAGFTLVDLLGERLGQDALAVSEEIKATASPAVGMERQSVKVSSLGARGGLPVAPSTTYPFVPGPEINVADVLVHIGDIAIVGLQAELVAKVGNQIKTESAFPHTIIATMVDGGAGYMPDASSYDRITYGARNTPYARGAAEAAASQIKDQLKRMHDDSAASKSNKMQNGTAQDTR